MIANLNEVYLDWNDELVANGYKRIARKTVLGVSDKVWHKPAYAATEDT